ncbi:MAG TPA: hypothetical protein GX701_03870 [Clostridiales bacterium]|jgi:hypothetical protein|nr:hypothetical protein [Clostridiales bacterium]
MTVKELNAALSSMAPPVELRQKIISGGNVSSIDTARQRPNRRIYRTFPAFAAAAMLLLLTLFAGTDVLKRISGENRLTSQTLSATPEAATENATVVEINKPLAFASVSDLAKFLLSETDWEEIYLPGGPFTEIEYLPVKNELRFHTAQSTIRVLVFPSVQEAISFAEQTPNFFVTSHFAHNDMHLETHRETNTPAGVVPLKELVSD